MKIVLDACAVIALVKNEQGADIVEEYLLNDDDECMIHGVNICEVYYGFFRSESEAFAQKIVYKLQERREEILEIAAKHGAFNVRVFGSVARGEETENSDIDFLINYNINKISSWFPVGLIHDLEDLLGRKVDVETDGAKGEDSREL